MSPESLADCISAAAAAASQAAKLLACTCGLVLLNLDVHTDCNTAQLRDCLASAGAHKKAPQPSTTLRHQECPDSHRSGGCFRWVLTSISCPAAPSSSSLSLSSIRSGARPCFRVCGRMISGELPPCAALLVPVTAAADALLTASPAAPSSAFGCTCDGCQPRPW